MGASAPSKESLMQIKVNMQDTIKTEDTQEIKPSSSFKDKVPSNWQIQPTDGGIVAYNTSSLETFEGSIEEFNKNLRG